MGDNLFAGPISPQNGHEIVDCSWVCACEVGGGAPHRSSPRVGGQCLFRIFHRDSAALWVLCAPARRCGPKLGQLSGGDAHSRDLFFS